MIISEVHALTNAELQARKEQATPRGIAVTCEFFVVRAENAELWDVEGRRFIDFSSGISVNNVGHRHPKVVRAIRQQLDCFIHTAYQVVPYPSLIHLANVSTNLPQEHIARKRHSSVPAPKQSRIR